MSRTVCHQRLGMSRTRKIIAIAVCFAMIFSLNCSESALAAQPQLNFLVLHPDNPHYFQWNGKPTVLVTSGEHYGAVLNLDFDYIQYLDELQRCGLNHTRTFTGVYREDGSAFHITDNTLAPADDRFICPWARSDEIASEGGNHRFDLTKWNEAYFVRLKDFVGQAAKRGIVVELTLFCPMYNDSMWQVCPMKSSNNINRVGDCASNEVYSLQHDDLTKTQIAVTRKIVSELRDYGNLYYEVCNEPYFGGVTMPWQHKIIETIVEAEAEFANQHLISLNIANGRQKIDQPHRRISIFNFHYCVPPDVVAMNAGLDKVIGENETGFRGSADVLYRTEGWDFLVAGGAIYNNLDYSFTAKHPDGTLTGYQSPGGGSVELRNQLGILKRLFDSIDFVAMMPDDSIVQSISPKLTTSVLANKGNSYVMYMHVPLPNKPDDLKQRLRDNIAAKLTLAMPEGTYQVRWLDTKTGNEEETEPVDHPGGSLKLESPKFDNDIALILVRSE